MATTKQPSARGNVISEPRFVAVRVRNLLVQASDEGAHAPQHVRRHEGPARALAHVARGRGGESGMGKLFLLKRN